MVDLKFNSLGNRLVVSSLDSVIRVWDVDNGTKFSEISCAPCENWKVDLVDNGRSVVTAGEQGIVKISDLETGEETDTLRSEGIDVFASCIAVVRRKRLQKVLSLIYRTIEQEREVPGDWKHDWKDHHLQQIR